MFRCFTSIVVFALLVAVAATLSGQEERRSTLGIVGVVGRWSEETMDGLPIVLADGRKEHSPSPEEADRISTVLFGRVDPGFALNATSPTAFSLGVIQSIPQLSEGTYRARFKLVTGASDQTAGLAFALQPNGEYLFVRYNTRDGNLALGRYANGFRERLAETAQKPPLSLGIWHELAVTITGTRIVGTVSVAAGAAGAAGGLRLEHDLKRSVAGRIGLWAKRDSVTMFTDVTVQPAR